MEPSMKINTLNYFLVLAESKSINEAAQKLFLSQPSLTKSLRLMEEELGMTLFYRTKSGIHLTESGKKILAEARQIVEIYNGWLEMAQKNNLPPIHFYNYISFSDFLIPDFLLYARKKYPDLKITFQSLSNPEDFITPDALAPVFSMLVCDKTLEKKYTKIQGNPPLVLMEGEYRCLLNPDSPLTKKKSIALEYLDDMYLLLPKKLEELSAEDEFLATIINNINHRVGPSHIIEVGTLQNVIDSVRKNDQLYALSYYPALERYQDDAKKRLAHVPIKGQRTRGNLCLFYSEQAASQYPVIRQLLEMLISLAQNFLKNYT